MAITQQEADFIQGIFIGVAVILSCIWSPRLAQWLVEKVRKW